jgi:hypothetical protein
VWSAACQRECGPAHQDWNVCPANPTALTYSRWRLTLTMLY